MSALADRLGARLHLLTWAQVVAVAEHDPAFWGYFASLALQPAAERAVDDEMARALINELETSRFPETRGRWPMLREHLRTAIWIAAEHAPSGPLAVAGVMGAAGFGGGLDQWTEIASAVSAVGTAASGAYNLYLQRRLAAARDAAERRAQEQEAARARAEQEEALERRRVGAPGTPGYPGPPAPSHGPSWATWAVLGALGLVVAGLGLKMARR